MTRRQHHLVPSAVLNASRDICAMEYQSRPQFHLLYRTVYAICAITYTVRSTQTENSNLQLVMTKDYALDGASNKNLLRHHAAQINLAHNLTVVTTPNSHFTPSTLDFRQRKSSIYRHIRRNCG